MKQILLPLLIAAGLCAQSVETIPLRAVLSPANEVPAVTDLNASGMGTVWAHVVRDANGQVTSGSVDFNVDFTFPGEVNITGLHIHPGAAGSNGPVVIASGVSGSSPVTSSSGTGNITRQAQVLPSDANGLAALRGLLADPSQYYLNLHTTTNPAGVMRGQLQRADMKVLIGLMSPTNEVPPVNLNASAVGTVVALRTFDTTGRLTTGRVIFDVTYAFPEAVTFSGLHIHPGAAGTNGPVVISSGLAGGTASAASGTGNLHYEAEVNLTSAAAVNALFGLYDNPGAYYINVHTTVNPGGVMRAQLRPTDRMNFQMTLLPSNEVPPVTGLDASAPSAVTIHSLRDADGNVTAGLVIFDVNTRFPGAAEFTGLHIHDGNATVSGPVTISSGLAGTSTVSTDTGVANIYRMVTVNNTAGLATLNSLVKNPEDHYLNVHTRVNGSGAARAQLAPANSGVPAVTAVISSISDPALQTVAQGGLMTIFGNNLAKVSGGLGGFAGDAAALSLNGTEVTVAGQKAPLVSAAPSFIVAQVPFEAAAGSQPLVVRTANGASAAFSTTVVSAAPGIFFDSVGGIVEKNSDFTLIRPASPARAGDVLLIYSTGLGQTTPPLVTGRVVTFPPPSNTAAVTVMIGGKPADVIYSIASPGFVGLYQTAVRVPAGIAAGNAPVTVSVGGAGSNTVNIAVQ